MQIRAMINIDNKLIRIKCALWIGKAGFSYMLINPIDAIHLIINLSSPKHCFHNND